MMIYQNNTHHMTFEKKTIDLSISSTPFAFSGTPELGSRKKQVLFFGKRKRQKKDTVDDWNVLQNHTFWKLRCPLKKDISSSNHQFSGNVLVFTGTNLLGIFTPNQKPLSEMSKLRGRKYSDRLLTAVDVCQLGFQHFLVFRWDKLLVSLLRHVFAGDQGLWG